MVARPKSHCGGGFSTAAFSAIASAAGLSANITNSDNDYGVDASIKTVTCYGGEYRDAGELFDIQIKSCTTWRKLENGKISYGIDRRTYDRLKNKLPGKKRLLIVMTLPVGEQDSWMHCEEHQTSIMRSLYFIDVDSISEIPDGQDSMTLHFEAENLLSPEKLKQFALDVYGGLMSQFAAEAQ